MNLIPKSKYKETKEDLNNSKAEHEKLRKAFVRFDIFLHALLCNLIIFISNLFYGDFESQVRRLRKRLTRY